MARQRFRVYGLKKMRAAPRRERLSHAKLRRGSRGRIENRNKPRVFKGRPAQSPQRVARAICKSPARPSADFGLVDLRKLVVFCDFQFARATLCGVWAGRPSKTRGFLRFLNRPRNPLRSLGWSTLKTRGFLQFPNRPCDPLRSFAWLNRSRCGAARIFLRP